ncbi:type 1 glutamine amidotransferase domain-containing protein [Tuwongella immobilis]|uniref:DJ-1/PfpI domain-containing protein n=1 Tax=Tuwongella immobilis TaxID=692036 RepID=A0A6C2YIB2_9BACT|nr:type 1 glutamine amidotransferase domain-containing protein [Tuwongella immobilis]VIP00732.1 peptidase : Intracellular protease, PfpI family OS=Methanohalobium evestigatum (strain DSM 3721 / OCM 161 / Z-7303) GN=Metev_0694 PE=4 SV=1: DJ-1_PfpI [Tuwongella immobilis]VTR96882.1 peptidase : Intracellular protease, PfpI family OS=Methanohalobium evestigatum (strain DSM 3721 / OCM 161 / Z-7303) GN=Metev_0694 PE=4 SV=1: DJ-1_PfpI [Tuwongella immobilis]
MKALILLADGFEDLQLFAPWYRLREENVRITIATPWGQEATGSHGYVVEADSPIAEINPNEYDLLVIPGGQAPARLRLREDAVGIARTFLEDGRRVAAIDHGVQLLISAGGLDSRKVTCHPSIRDDVRFAGANYRDEAVVVDGSLLTGRGNEDLPQFCRSLVAGLAVRA